MESDFIQDAAHLGNGDKTPTVEDGTQQDETKNGHLGNDQFFDLILIHSNVIFLDFVIYYYFFIFVYVLFYFNLKLMQTSAMTKEKEMRVSIINKIIFNNAN